MLDHTLNIEKARQRALNARLEVAKREHEHDEITSAAANLRDCEERIQRIMRS